MATIAEPIPPRRAASRPSAATGELQMRRLVIAHVWVAIAAFAVACLLGVWQMWARSPLEAPAHTAANYFRSVTLHGVSMAFVLTTFFIMGFGYFVAETALKRPLPGLQVGLGRVLDGPGRRADGGAERDQRQCLGALHLLSAADRDRLVLHRPGAGRRRVLDLVPADDRRDAPVEGRQPGPASAAGDVRDRRQCGHVAVDDAWASPPSCCSRSSRRRSASTAWSTSACRAPCFPGRSTRSSISGSSRATSPSTPWRRERPAGGSIRTRWAGSPSSCSCSTRCRSGSTICSWIRSIRTASNSSRCS